jgi:uncharacterized protein (TIGR01244 family)
MTGASCVFLCVLLAVGCGAASTATSDPGTATGAGNDSSRVAGAPVGTASEGTALGLPGERAISDGLVIGGQPTEENLRAAQAAGYGTVITLRTVGEPGTEGEQALVEELGMRFVSIPVDRETGLTADNARALDAALAEAGEAPVLLHCGSGNRVSALLAVRAFLVEGLGVDAALGRMRDWGLSHLEAKVREVLEALCAEEPGRDC